MEKHKWCGGKLSSLLIEHVDGTIAARSFGQILSQHPKALERILHSDKKIWKKIDISLSFSIHIYIYVLLHEPIYIIPYIV